MSRTVNGERLFDDVAKEALRRQIRQVAGFTGLEVLIYAVLENHFHVLVRVPRRQPVPDGELLRRYAVLYPKPARYQTATLGAIKAELADNGPAAARWRQRLGRHEATICLSLLWDFVSPWFIFQVTPTRRGGLRWG